jgi:hypothetical protein
MFYYETDNTAGSIEVACDKFPNSSSEESEPESEELPAAFAFAAFAAFAAAGAFAAFALAAFALAAFALAALAGQGTDTTLGAAYATAATRGIKSTSSHAVAKVSCLIGGLS